MCTNLQPQHVVKPLVVSRTVWTESSLVVFCNLTLFRLNADSNGQETSCLDDRAFWVFIAKKENPTTIRLNEKFLNYLLSNFTSY